jgi:hypothetical protein
MRTRRNGNWRRLGASFFVVTWNVEGCQLARQSNAMLVMRRCLQPPSQAGQARRGYRTVVCISIASCWKQFATACRKPLAIGWPRLLRDSINDVGEFLRQRGRRSAD